jgi:carbon-monoxide dehydrogenase iron sulfur subunit
MGCGLCRVYCQTANPESGDIIKAHKKESRRPLPRIRLEKNGEVCFSLQCRHCDEPWCAYSCLTGAMRKKPATGRITVDTTKCMGCWTCIVACPNGALTRDTNNKVVTKSDLCPEHESTVCVANCLNEALFVVEHGKAKASQVVKV